MVVSTLADAQDIQNTLDIVARLTSGDPNEIINVAQGVLTKKHPDYDNLSKGARGSQVFTLQQLLCNAGYPTDNDGIFGEKTYTTLLNFQRDKQLQQTGSTNNETWSALLPSNPDWNKIKNSCSQVVDTSATEVTTQTNTQTNTSTTTDTKTPVPTESNTTMWIVISVIMGLLIFGTLIFFILK